MRKLLVVLTAVLLFSGQLLAQKTVTGTVTDEKGDPIPNASVIVKGSNTGTVTKPDGTFSLSIPASAKTLVVSSVDMTTQEVAIGSQTSFSVTLKTSDKSLQEVVVVGYGVQQKKAFTGAASKVDVKEFANLMTPSVDKQLAGRATGVQVTNVGGQVNSPARIRVRGINSLNQSNDPLIVVDGIPIISGNLAGTTNSNALGDINPADIESMEVLKDGSSTAIYGSRAAAGVIIITTKKGSKGRARLTYDGFYGLTSALKKFDLLNADQFVTIANEKFTNAGQAPRANPNPGVDTDWQDAVMNNNAATHSHTLSLQGGNDKTTYYLSLNFSDQKGIIISNYNRSYRVRMNLEHEVNKAIKVGNNITLSRQEDGDQNNGSNALGGAIAASLRLLPNVSPYNPNHPSGFNINYPNGNSMNGAPNTTSVDDNFNNVAFTLRANKYYSDKYRLINNTFIEITPIRNLKLRTQFSADLLTDYSYQGLSPMHGDGYGTATGGTNGSVFNSSQNRLRYVWQNYFSYNISFNNTHNIYLTAGHELQQDKVKSHSASGSNISDEFFINENLISGSAAVQSVGGSISESGFESLFARLNYDYKNKYFIQGSIRRDGQSALAQENRYGVFPGVSAGWRVSEEDFWGKSTFTTKWITEFKLKGSYAVVGNTLGGFPYLSTYAARPYGNISGISVGAIGNPALRWEKSKKFDVGVDLGLLNGRLNLTADWFLNNVDDLVFGVPTPLSVGVPGNSISQNIASMENKGIEISLGGTIMSKGDFRWDASINYSNVKNEIKSLYSIGGEPVAFVENGSYNIIRVGDPINVIYGSRWAGVNSANGNPMFFKADGSLVQINLTQGVGNVGGFYTANGKDDPALGTSSSLSFADRVVLGNPTPTWFGALNNTFSYKGLTLDFMLRYSGGNRIMNYTRQEVLFNQSFQNNGVEILERWTTPGQQTDVPKLYYGQGNNINQTQTATSRFVEKGDYLRLQNVVLSYSLSNSVLQRIGNSFIRSARIYVQGQNLAVWTAYKGADPDNISALGVDAAVSPQVRTISFGLSVGL